MMTNYHDSMMEFSRNNETSIGHAREYRDKDNDLIDALWNIPKLIESLDGRKAEPAKPETKTIYIPRGFLASPLPRLLIPNNIVIDAVMLASLNSNGIAILCSQTGEAYVVGVGGQVVTYTNLNLSVPSLYAVMSPFENTSIYNGYNTANLGSYSPGSSQSLLLSGQIFYHLAD